MSGHKRQGQGRLLPNDDMTQQSVDHVRKFCHVLYITKGQG